MSWTTDTRDQADFRRQAERVMSMPLGMVNPFWLIFGAAATAGMTWWWINRLARTADVEAARESAAIYEMAEATAATTPIAIRGAKPRKAEPPRLDAAADYAEANEAFETADAAGFPHVMLDPVVPLEAKTATHESEIPAETSQNAGAAGYPIVAPGPEAVEAADDFTVLSGVGPRIAAALAEHGVTRFAQLAAWSAEQLAAFDQEMNLRGRAIRSDWIEQAKRFAAQ